MTKFCLKTLGDSPFLFLYTYKNVNKVKNISKFPNPLPKVCNTQQKSQNNNNTKQTVSAKNSNNKEQKSGKFLEKLL